ncbi:MAG: DUF6273 domain-containing protein, partial [Synergistaceae bacterium]|nr:DUF6273 domain-containing protein [Synergistaceae bacterium]
MKFLKIGIVLLLVIGLGVFAAGAFKPEQARAAGEGPTAESLMKRGWLFLEDSEWVQADEYFDKVLDIDPEHAPAYIGKLCAALKINKESELADNFFDKNNKDYQKALRFADANYRAKLEGYAKAAEGKLKAGQILQMGGYDWRVLDVQNNRALLLCENVIEKRPYNKEKKNITWETCDLREYLNGEFYNKLPGDFKAKIAETKLTNDNNQ